MISDDLAHDDMGFILAKALQLGWIINYSLEDVNNTIHSLCGAAE